MQRDNYLYYLVNNWLKQITNLCLTSHKRANSIAPDQMQHSLTYDQFTMLTLRIGISMINNNDINQPDTPTIVHGPVRRKKWKGLRVNNG